LGSKVLVNIVGDEPLAGEVSEAATRLTGVEWLGQQPKQQILALMKEARFLVLPSTWYEVFPLVIVEAYATGLPVIASNMGGMSSLIDHGRTGLHFRPGDAENLAEQVEWALAHPTQLERMRCEARSEYETKYTAERNYWRLMEIYEKAIARARTQV
jgi:glycosyltransferase involved in cell wall biosynthesis